MPKVSVIMPCYNVEKYVARCLNSLTAQTLCDIEIICIDDKSTDATPSIIQEFAHHDPRITLYTNKENLGVSSARNTGISMATGNYISFVDPDDYLDIDFYQKLYDAATKHDADIAKGELKTVNTTGNIEHYPTNHKIAENKFHFNSCFTTGIYRTSMLKENNISFPLGISMAEDRYMLISAVYHANKIQTVDNTFYNYIRHEGSLDSTDFPTPKLDSALKGACELLNLINAMTNINDQDYGILLKCVAENIKYIHSKQICHADHKKVAECFIWIYNHAQQKHILRKVWGNDIYKYASKRKTTALSKFCATVTTWTWLFGFIPLAKTTKYLNNEFTFYLFGLLPFFKKTKTHKTQFSLFGITILKIKTFK